MDSLPRRLLLSALAVALGLALLEGIASGADAIAKTREQIASRHRPEHRDAQHDPTLGGVITPELVARA